MIQKNFLKNGEETGQGGRLSNVLGMPYPGWPWSRAVLFGHYQSLPRTATLIPKVLQPWPCCSASTTSCETLS